MRKFFAAVLALTMVLSISAAAFAAETADGYVSAERTAEITVKKLYNVIGSQNASLYPQETLTFVSTPGDNNPDATNLIIAPLTVSGNSNQNLTITVPSYSQVGTYHYTLTEAVPTNKTQGVSYSEAEIAVTVLVTYDYENDCLQSEIVLGTGEAAEGKLDTFTNQYDVGTLTLSKTVEGNLGDRNTYFDIHVTFHSVLKVASDIPVTGGSYAENPKTLAADKWVETADGFTYTETFKLKHSDTLTFSDIPKDVTYTVVEDAKHGVGTDGFSVNSAGDTDYTVSYDNGTSKDGTGTIASNATVAQKVTNEKKTTVETGVLLDSMPYVLMLTVAFAGIIVLFGKKRYEV